MLGALEFIFWPSLNYPKKEVEIHEGRKRIDITFTNAAQDGFFHRAHDVRKIPCSNIMVECKNYSNDPKNPEIDQISGRFSPNRGKIGLLVYRDCSSRKLLVSRCHDTAVDQRGNIMPLGDSEIINMLSMISSGNRNCIDGYLEEIFTSVND